MDILKKLVFFCLLLNCYSNTLLAESFTPWFTGPLFAPGGKTAPPNHFNFEVYGFYTDYFGTYNNNWSSENSREHLYTAQAIPILTYGLTDTIDAQFNIPYAENRTRHIFNRHIGDVAATLGFQLYQQGINNWFDLRLTVQEIFPTGRFDDLNPTNQGVDGTGVGSYQTGVALNFQHLMLVGNHHVRQRFVVNYVGSTSANIHGTSVYGGNIGTRGSINPGNLFSLDWAGEFQVTRNWVAVMEAFYFYRTKRTFSGFAGIDEDGNLYDLTQGSASIISLAPAIEYNFSPHYGIIAGVWFPLRGKNISDFISGVVAFNAYF